MTKRENILPLSPIGELIHNATGKRVSNSAKITANKILEELTEKIMKKAIMLAEHSGRKTIKAKDINLSYNQLKGEL